MKKLLLSGLALTFCLTSIAQTNRQALQSRLSPTISNKVAQLKKPGEVYAAPVSSTNPTVGQTKNSMVEVSIGQTSYDLQSNYGTTGQRIIRWDDNSISAIWTFATGLALSPPERGTGYNYYDGSAWGAAPIARIESFKTGFGSLAGSSVYGEAVVSHGSNSSLGAACSTSTNLTSRATKGSGAWNEAPLSCGSVIWWPRVAIGGANGTTIHALGNDNAGGPVNYSRSTDGGTTWVNENITLPDFTTDFFEGPVDAYQVATRGDVVAIVMGGFAEDLTLWKSTDNGANWVKTTINHFPLAPFDYTTTISDVDGDGVADTVNTTDSGVALAIDNYNTVHVAVGSTRILNTTPNTVGANYFPGTDGLLYWNESLPAGDITNNVIAFVEDIDGSGVIEIPDGLAIYQCSLTGMPTLGVDASNNIHLSYSSIIENTTNGNPDPLLEEAFRNVYYMNSIDGGTTWSTPSRVEPSLYDEQVWPSMAAKVDNNIHLVYHKDGEPGNSYQASESPAGTEVPDPYGLTDVIYNNFTNPVGLNENSASEINTVIYPNPVQNVLHVDYTFKNAQTITVQLVDVLGQVVYSSEVKAVSGVNNVSINVKNYAAGVYSLNTIAGSSLSSEKVIIR